MISIFETIAAAMKGRRFGNGGLAERSMWGRIARDLDSFISLPAGHERAQKIAEHVRLVVEECTEPDVEFESLKAKVVAAIEEGPTDRLTRAVYALVRRGLPDSHLTELQGAYFTMSAAMVNGARSRAAQISAYYGEIFGDGVDAGYIAASCTYVVTVHGTCRWQGEWIHTGDQFVWREHAL